MPDVVDQMLNDMRGKRFLIVADQGTGLPFLEEAAITLKRFAPNGIYVEQGAYTEGNEYPSDYWENLFQCDGMIVIEPQEGLQDVVKENLRQFIAASNGSPTYTFLSAYPEKCLAGIKGDQVFMVYPGMHKNPGVVTLRQDTAPRFLAGHALARSVGLSGYNADVMADAIASYDGSSNIGDYLRENLSHTPILPNVRKN